MLAAPETGGASLAAFLVIATAFLLVLGVDMAMNPANKDRMFGCLIAGFTCGTKLKKLKFLGKLGGPVKKGIKDFFEWISLGESQLSCTGYEEENPFIDFLVY